MRMTPPAHKLPPHTGLYAATALLVAATSPAWAPDMTRQLTTVWIPATVYGLTLIVAFSRIQDK